MGQILQLNRPIQPVAPPEFYKTYSLRMPLKTHWRPATCEEVGCDHYRYGWVTTVDLGTELGQKRAHYMEHDLTRRHSRQQVSETLAKYLFGPGQRCFSAGEHRTQVGRPPRFLVAEGDWRGNPRQIPVREFRSGEEWVGDFGEHQQVISEAVERG